MFVSYNILGSVVLDVDGPRLDAIFLDTNGTELDHYTILKDPDLITDFIAAPLSGGVPLTVAFTDLSVGNPTQWAWDFDNNGSVDSTEQHPVYEYTKHGLNTVRLVATGTAGAHEKIKEDYHRRDVQRTDSGIRRCAINRFRKADG